MTELKLSELTAAHLGKHIRELDTQQDDMVRGALRRRWTPVSGKIVGIRQFIREPGPRKTTKGIEDPPHPFDQSDRWTSVIVEQPRQAKQTPTHREILAPSAQKVDVNT